MNDRIDDERQWVSALADGQALQDEADLEALTRDPQAREAWQDYHLIGDVLRSPDLAGTTPPAVFLARFRERLTAGGERLAADGVGVEPLPSPPDPAAPMAPVPAAGEAAAVTAGTDGREAANEGLFRGRRAVGLASLALALAVGGFTVDAWRSPAESGLARDASGRMLRDARLDDLLSAHRQSGGTALPAPAGFVHPASFERPAAAPAR